MTELRRESVRIPQWDLADRLRKSLRVAGLDSADMADYLGMHRNSIGGYLNGHREPDLRTMRLWALRTGVPLVWLRDGDDDGPNPDDGLPREGSNLQPFGYRTAA